MSEELLLIQKLLAAIVVGYLLGSIPLAHLFARRRGIDIFATGSTRAGTANIFWNISRRNGVLVFAGDVIKGFLAIQFASLLGIPESALILAGGAAVAGHWKSIFTRFRGGDGMVVLIGVTFALTPLLTLLAVLVGVITVLLTRRSPFRSSLAIAAGFAILLVISRTFPYFYEERLVAMELCALALLVILHNVFIHRLHAPLLAGESNDSVGETEFHGMHGVDDPDLDPEFPDDC